MKRLTTFVFSLLMLVPAAFAQINYGVDLMSRYVWRGLDLDNGLSLQPTLEFSKGNLTVGAWGNLPLASGAEHKAFKEVDFYAYYSKSIGKMGIDLGVTDYVVGGEDFDWGNFDSDGGQHLLELNVRLNGPEDRGWVLQVNKNFYNEPDKSTHVAFSYPMSVSGFDLKATVGGVLNGSDEAAPYYSEKAGILETSLEVGRTFGFIPGHDTTIKVIGIYNPMAKAFYPVVGLSIWKN